MSTEPRYRRVLLKCSGEAMMGDDPFGINFQAAERIVKEVKRVLDIGVEVAIVVGGGNIFRGVSTAAAGMDRASADHMGMLATVMNGLALEDAFRHQNVEAVTMSAIPMEAICETYTRRTALTHLKAGKVVICVAGTSNPFFTTDTAAALRAAELRCDALTKGTQVDGVYTADPQVDPAAERYDSLTYQDVLVKQLKVMDASAISLSRENGIPIIVFSLHDEDGFKGAITGQGVATVITEK